MSQQPLRIEFGRKILELATQTLILNESHRKLANTFTDFGVKSIDALHLAIAHEAKAIYLTTCDDRFISASKRIPELNCNLTSPTEFVINNL